uniref:SSD domain-containing protein n=1 Tax=Angiostrongylus cantonensis TaxID=6313 RepID=A0A158PBD0_ANGCA
MVAMGRHATKDTCFIRFINFTFEKVGYVVSYAPWSCIILSCLATLVLSLKIPFTKMENNISDFTPYGARSRQEQKIYCEFFLNRGEPKAIYAFIYPKHGGNLLNTSHFNHTVQVLDKISHDFYMRTPNGNKNFEQLCEGFCAINEPIRHFYSGMLISEKYTNRSRHLDLGYPITTVLGTKLHMDPNLFGVKVAVKDDRGQELVISTTQLQNNIREVALIVLQFRLEIGSDITHEDIDAYEHSIVNHFQTDVIIVDILTDSYITSEIVRAGLSLVPFLAVGFTIMVTFSVTLAVMACVCPFMACGAALGALFWVGFRFGSTMCVTPFLVLAIGVDDAYLMMNAWQRITSRRRKIPFDNVDLEVRGRIVEMLVQTGPSVSITTITNFLAFSVGALTPTPEIRLFSVGNAFAIVVDFIFQLSIYASLMVIVGRYEIQREFDSKCLDLQKLPEQKSSKSEKNPSIGSRLDYTFPILLLLLWYVCIIGTLNMKPQLSPDRLFLEDSRIFKVFEERQKYITPYYSVCWILVEQPGDISNFQVAEFENLPNSVGRYSTKFWLRDYEDFLKQGEELDIAKEYDDLLEPSIMLTQNGSFFVSSTAKPKGNELKQFLEWPEFSFWKGFIQLESNKMGTEYTVTRFFFTTAFQGRELEDWSNRAVLLNQWRFLVDKYSDLKVSIYEDDAKFLDMIETMVPVSLQSALFTFICMFAVTVLFISHLPTLFVATLSILSTSVGVFGIMSLKGAQLDPIMMSATVMCIGFSVDIPSHISYHYHHTEKGSGSVMERLKGTVRSVGFPIMQASVSTTLCLLSLLCVKLHMSQTFAECMLLVVLIGTIHGILIIPVIFNLISILPFRHKLVVITKRQ